MRYNEVYIHNDERTWATWDHHPFYARIQEDGHSNNFEKAEKMNWTGWKPKTEEQSAEFTKKVMEKNEGAEGDLDIIQWNNKTAAGKLAHHTKAEREKIMNIPENVRLRGEAAARCTAKIKKVSTQGTSLESQSGAPGEMLLATSEEKRPKESR